MTDSKTTPPSDTDDFQPDYSALFTEREMTLVLDENGDLCNPTVFHPTQAQFEREAMQQNLRHPRKMKNEKEECLERGALRARKILHERRTVVANTAKRIDDASDVITKAGMCCFGVHAYFGAPIIGLGLGMKYLNKHIAAKGQAKLDMGLNALAVCTNKEVPKDKKREARDQLKEAEHHVRYWEKTRSVTATVVQFAFGELNVLVSGAQLLFQLNGSMAKKKKQNPASSESLRGALSQVYYGLDIKGPKQDKRASGFNASPEF